jgi:GTP-binding protein Era
MLIEHQHPLNKSIMVSVLGAPNVGKSSLINCLMGFDLSVVTSKPQTTRNKFHCVINIDHTEMILVDTPGVHINKKEINKRMNEQAKEGIQGSDLNLLLIDLSREIFKQFEEFKNIMKMDLNKTWVVFTKADKVENPEQLPLNEVIEKAKLIEPSIERFFTLSSKTGDNVHLLTGALCDTAESGPHLYTDGAISNKNERFFVAEYIREQAFSILKEELPYEIAVTVEEFMDNRKKEKYESKSKKEPSGIASMISASILVNRASQRAIVVGSKGSVIKEIGTRARKKIEAMVGGQVHLNLHVKVSPNWYKNNFVLEELGLPRAVDSLRVWRKK